MKTLESVQTPKRKRLKCPFCNGRVIDSFPATKARLYVLESADKPYLMETASEFHIDFVTKCGNCKRDIGIQKV